MSTVLITRPPRDLTFCGQPFPRIIADAGPDAMRRFLEFFTANIRNANTRSAYARAVAQFCLWCDQNGLVLTNLQPIVIAGYIEHLAERPTVPVVDKDGRQSNSVRALKPPSVKQHLAAIRMLFDFLVLGQIVKTNPASSVRGPKYVVKRGKTKVLDALDARKLLDSIDITNVVGLRDRAIIGVMVFSFARVSAVVGMKVEDYYQNGRRSWFRLHEKGGKFHEVPAHHNAEAYLDAYITMAGIGLDKKGPIFRSAIGKTKTLTGTKMDRTDVLRMIKRRALEAGLPYSVCCHTFRATGITAYLANGGTLEKAQAIADHESPRTTKLYDRTKDEVSLDEVERILI